MSSPWSFVVTSGIPIRAPVAPKAPPAVPTTRSLVERAALWRDRFSRLCEMPEADLAKIDIAVLNLACAEDLPGIEGVDVGDCLRKLDVWAYLVKVHTEHWWPSYLKSPSRYENSPNRFRMMSLVTVLQRHLGVRYYLPFFEGEYDATDSRNLFIHGLLGNHGGSCVSMPVLYIAIGRRLGYPLRLVSAYSHYFARWEGRDGERFNIECTSPGFVSHTDERYERLPIPIPPELLGRGYFLRNLSPREELAGMLIQRGRCLIDNLRLREAECAFHYAYQLAGCMPGLQNAWVIASILREAIEGAFEKAHAAGRHAIDVRNLAFPDREAWQREAARVARECIARIMRNRSRKGSPLRDEVFCQRFNKPR